MTKVTELCGDPMFLNLEKNPRDREPIPWSQPLQDVVCSLAVLPVLSFSSLQLGVGLMAPSHAKAPVNSRIYDIVDLKLHG